jgi:hypothetical protein
MPRLPTAPELRTIDSEDDPGVTRTLNASFQCTFELMRELRERAAREERTVSSLIRHALRAYLRTPPGPHPLRDTPHD